MRVLYVIRDRSSRKLGKRLHRWATGFLDGQDGFFEASLHQACTVTRMPYSEAMALPADRRDRFDAVVVNAKSGLPWGKDPTAALAALNGFKQPVSLFIGHAQPEVMPGDALLDRCKVIFKREPFADRERYDISEANAAKIVPTNLSNPMRTLSWRLPGRNRVKPLPQYGWQTDKVHDVFFVGSIQPKREFSRSEIWSAIRETDLDAVGGVLPNGNEPVPVALRAQSMPKDVYRQHLFDARVNIAAEGLGPFTFRHLELFWAGSLTLSTPSIRPLRLRAPLVEGQDYVAFDDLDDMIDKTRYYCARDEERNRIAKAGRAAFERLYDVRAHASEIAQALAA